MFKDVFQNLLFITYIFFVTGCVHQELAPPDQTSNLTQEDNSQSSTSTVDISDLKSTIQTSAPAPTTPKPTPKVVSRVPFPTQEYAKLSRKGSATIQGRIYLVTINGQNVYGKNTRLYLNPVTSYSKQWYQESYISGKKLSKADPRLYNYLRFTASDNNGKFSFFEIPTGRYYLIGIVRCKDECGYSSYKNIRIAKEVTVGTGETINVNLSKHID